MKTGEVPVELHGTVQTEPARVRPECDCRVETHDPDALAFIPELARSGYSIARDVLVIDRHSYSIQSKSAKTRKVQGFLPEVMKI